MANRSLGTLTLDLVAKIGGFTQSMNQAAQVVDNRMKSIQDSATKAKNALSSVFALTVGGLTAKGLIDMADQYGQMASRIKMVTASTDEYNQVQQRLLQTANITFRPLQEAQEVYIRTSDAIKSLGYNTDQALSITDSFSYLLVTNSASADKANAAIAALSKSIETGKVKADSWTTILTTTPSIVNSIAESSGMATEAVRKLGAEGKLSLDILVKALLDTEKQNKTLAENMPTTVGDALTKLKNNVTALVGEQNRAYGATALLSQGISVLSDNIDIIAAGAFVGLAAKAGAMASSLLSSSIALANNMQAVIANDYAEKAAVAAKIQSLTATMRQSQALASQAQQLTLNAHLNEMATRGTVEHTAALNTLAAARRNEVAANLQSVQATKALNIAQSAATGVSRGLLGVLGGPVGIGLTVASVAAGWLLFKDNTSLAAEALSRIEGTIEQVTEKLNKLSDVQLKATYDATLDKINALKQSQKELAESAIFDLRSNSQTYDVAGEFFTDDKNIKAAIAYFEELNRQGKNFAEASIEVRRRFEGLVPDDLLRRLTDTGSKVNDLQDEIDGLEKKIGLTKDALDGVGKVAQSMIATFNSLGTSMQSALSPEQAKKYESIIGNIENRILSLQDPSGMLSLKKSLSDIKISEGTKEWDDAIALHKTEIDLLNKRNQLKSSTKTVDDVAKAYKNQSNQLTQQIALYGQTSEAAKMRYELANGELKVLSDTEKQLLINKSIEIDQLNARKEYDSMMKELRTNEEKVRDTLAERVALLDKANIKGKEYVDAMAKISKATVSEAPKFGGIDASVGGASGELIKVAESQKELDKWRAKELEQQQKYLDEKLIAEEQYADNVIEINKRTAQSQEQLNSAWQIATIGTFSTVTGDVADMFKEMAGESSAAYKIMFAASKAAAIAQAIISTEVAANKALEMGTILGIPAATAVRALGYASVGMIAATSIAGMAHSGIDNIPEEGTWLLDKGERVLSPRQNSDLTKFLNNTQSSGIATANVAPQVSITVNQDGSGSVSSSAGYENMGRQMFEQIRQIAKSTIIQEKGKGGVLDGNNRRNA